MEREKLLKARLQRLKRLQRTASAESGLVPQLLSLGCRPILVVRGLASLGDPSFATFMAGTA
eukprot:7546884-Alexandrium_andersonii.AAC.1